MTPTSSPQILLVEDEPLICLEAEEVLTRAGYVELTIANTVEAALKALTQVKPDCGIVDLNLGGQSGMVILDKLVQLNVPIIVTTGYYDGRKLRDQLGAQVLEKPYEESELLNAVTKALGQSLAV